MDHIILQTVGLTKRYQHTLALDQVNVTIKKGGIYGFVGKNGAGKTTFMRIIAGLAFPDQGTINLYGASDKNSLAVQRKRMGCLIEAPAFYSYMTATENMEAMRIAKGIPNRKASSQVLEIVGLQDTGKKKLQDFSMGMKQRLAIAVALLGKSEFLMLDEPTNGLDPVSIVEMRELLMRLVHEKQITILISSHILGELYHLATHYILIDQGRIVQEISKEALDRQSKKHISIAVDDVPHALTVIEQKLQTRHYRVMPDGTILLYDYLDEMQTVITALASNHIKIENMTVAGDSLETYFIKTIGGDERA